MIKLAYYSWTTRNTYSFMCKLPYVCVDIQTIDCIEEPFVLFTPTYNTGKVPEFVSEWLTDNHSNMVGVIGFGNKNWGDLFANSANIISEQYGVPVIDKVEMRGKPDDVLRVIERLKRFK